MDVFRGGERGRNGRVAEGGSIIRRKFRKYKEAIIPLETGNDFTGEPLPLRKKDTEEPFPFGEKEAYATAKGKTGRNQGGPVFYCSRT